MGALTEFEPVIKVVLLLLKIFGMFFVLRAILYLVGFRYNIPLVDDVFWAVINWVTRFGLGVSTGIMR